ncbi:uncharacterized protein [Miscanthus floridulus]|uniref:uncharacterized protein n=1 Tax=Miscanthus floridulus TaxID=154761 RepID=UPI00345A6166
MDDRQWMYTGYQKRGQYTNEWIEKANDFMTKAFANGRRHAWCPCRKCKNKAMKTYEEMGKDLVNNGFVENYTRWTMHGERHRAREEVVRQRIEEFDSEAGVAEMLNDHDMAFDEGSAEQEPEQTAKAFYAMLDAAQQPLHGRTNVSKLDAIARLMAVKSQFSWSRESFDQLLTVVGTLLPDDHVLPKNTYESNKILRALKMSYEQIHACPNGCILFRGEHADDKYCPKCKASRYIELESGDGRKTQTKVGAKILRYLPFIPRIQRLFMSEESAKQMTWHKTGRRYTDKMIHPSDGESWKSFDRKHTDKANEARNVRIALATDGFNPYGMGSSPYTCWPVFVIPLNLPPGVAFQRQNILLSLIIPGHPGANMSVYMEPLIDDLVRAWDEGVVTYDRFTKTNFRMHIWYHYSMHDFLAYGLFCGWCVHTKMPCPICKSAVEFFRLEKGGKFSSFDKHRQFLPLDHPFRRDKKNFRKGVTVENSAPEMMTGAQVLEMLDGLVVDNEKGGFVGYGKEHAWTHKSCLWKLPYFKDLLLPHNIDVMHTEKNFAEAVLHTIMDWEKSKDNVKARLDQATLCDRPKLNMLPPLRGKSWKKPKADFVLTRAQKKEVLQWFQSLMFPDGYAANWRRGVNLSTMRITGLKSHDYHIWIERLLPVMVRGYFPDHIWRVMAELSMFFRKLCAKEISRTEIEEMERMAPVLLCKLEKIFPPGFFNPMQHLLLHLPYEAKMGGPVHARWCYPIERCLKVLRTKCKNKCKIEASCAEASIVEEVSYFTTRYYADNLPNVHNPPPRYNAADNQSTLSLFRGQLGSASEPTLKMLSLEEWRSIQLYVLRNLEEVGPYIA